MTSWSASSFHTIDVTDIQKIVKHMTQTIMLLEKGGFCLDTFAGCSLFRLNVVD